MLYLFSFLKSLQFFGSVTVPFYLQRMSFSYTQMFLMEMIFSVSLFLFEIPTGVVADRFGRRASIFVGSICFGSSFVIIGLTHSVIVFAIAQVLGAFGMSLISGADSALVYENSKLKGKTDKQAAVVASRYDAFSTTACLIAMPLGSVFVSIFQKEGITSSAYLNSLGATMWITGLVTILSAFLILFVKEPPVSAKQNGVSSFQHAVQGVLILFKNKSLTRVSFNYSIISGLTFLMFWMYQSLLTENGFPISINGFISSGFNLGGILILLATGIVIKKLGVKRTTFLTSFIPGVLYILLFVFPTSKVVILLAIFGITIIRFFRRPLFTTLINNQIDNENRATVLSGISMFERIVISIMYPIAGFLLDYASRFFYLFIGIVILIVSFFVRIDDTDSFSN